MLKNARKEVIKITIPALKYFLKNGLDGVKDLPEKKVAEMRLALALNFTDKEGFMQAMQCVRYRRLTKLGAIFDDETHLSIQMDGLESAKKLQMDTKVWIARVMLQGHGRRGSPD